MKCEEVIQGVIIILKDFDEEQILEAWDAMHDRELFEEVKESNDLVIMAAMDKTIYKALEFVVDSF